MAANANGPTDVIVRSLPPFKRSTSPEPARPVTVPPIVNTFVAQLMVTSVTLALPIVPDGFATVQVCSGFVGCAFRKSLFHACSWWLTLYFVKRK